MSRCRSGAVVARRRAIVRTVNTAGIGGGVAVKAAPFQRHAPSTVDQAVELLGSKEEPTILAGGQSTVPIMRFRLASPDVIDINGISGLDQFGEEDGHLRIGALDVRMIERREVEPPETAEGVSVSIYAPEETEEAVDGADVAFVTGSTLLYGGTEAYLEASRGVPDVVLVGATASFAPEPAFDAGATMLAGARVADAGATRVRIPAGECATDIHDDGLEVVFVTAEGSPVRLDLDPR